MDNQPDKPKPACLKQVQQKGEISKFYIEQPENQPSMFFSFNFIVACNLASQSNTGILEHNHFKVTIKLPTAVLSTASIPAEIVNIIVVLCLIASAVDIVRNSKKTIQAKIK